MNGTSTPELVERLARGDIRALARAISMVEESAPAAHALLRAAYPRGGRAAVIGITGSPGAGKSTLVDRLIAVYRAEGRRIGVAAVDPSSAYSGGAILGDRVRMQEHSTDPGVFIRSMATRGHLGGLARATHDVVDLLDAAGYDPVIVETVGVGQDEIEVVRAADAVVVVLVPGMGDDIQAIKAGILEIADLFVVNKIDRPGGDRVVADLEAALALAPPTSPKPEILRVSAVRGEGITELRDAIERFLDGARSGGLARRRRERAESRLRAVLADRLVRDALERGPAGERFARIVDEIAGRRTDPYSGVEQLVGEPGHGNGDAR